MKRYKISSDGKVLTDTKANTTLSVATFEVVMNGSIPSISFNGGIEGKMQKKIARSKIDESEFSFGPAPTVRKSETKPP